jgi:hypothetical protein
MRPQAALTMINEMMGLKFQCTEAEIANGAVCLVIQAITGIL